jgi:SPP1 gp7 family putative phage head morphogenesis protein
MLNRWLYPDSKEREMQRMLIRELRALHAKVISELRQANLLRIDAEEDEYDEDMKRAVESLIAWWLLRVAEIRRQLESLYVGISAFNDRQFRLLIRQLTGVLLQQARSLGPDTSLVTPQSVAQSTFGEGADVARVEPWHKAALDRFVLSASANAEKMGRDFIVTTQTDTMRRAIQKQAESDIASAIADREETLEAKAALLARAEVAAANGELSMRRQMGLLLQQYKWRTCRDEKVRPSHNENEGRTFRWDRAPDTGHPGQAYCCRCWSEPALQSSH